jgi:DNA-binding response OmpR family regulator
MKIDASSPVQLHEGSRIEETSMPSELIKARRILVTDDDPILCGIIAAALEDDGFVVDMAFDGEKAWEILVHRHYDLLVTDNEMPRLTGMELVERVRNAGLGLPVIVASGSLSLRRASDYPPLQIAAVIPKPFALLEVLNTVRNVLPD